MKKLSYTNEDIYSFCTELTYLLHAGIGGADALTMLAEDETRKEYREVLSRMARKADEGETLPAVISGSGCFPDFVGRMAEVGEKTGRSEEALTALAATCGRRAGMEKKLKSALLYPSVLLLIMLAVIAVLLIYVMPVFGNVYAQLGGSLTGIAGGLLSLGQVLGKWFPLLAGVFCLAVVFLAAFSLLPSFRGKVTGAWQRKRGDRGVAGKTAAATFAQALSLAMSSGMGIDEAVEGAAQLVSDSAGYGERIAKCTAMLKAGEGTAKALRESGLIPAAQCRILEAGIQGGSGEKAMDSIARRLTEESEDAIDSAISRVEPAMVVVTSLLVGLILLSVMLPLVNIMNAIG